MVVGILDYEKVEGMEVKNGSHWNLVKKSKRLLNLMAIMNLSLFDLDFEMEI